MYGEDFERKVNEIVASYPQPRGAVMPILHLVQEKADFVPLEAEVWVADRLGLTPSFVHGIVTFYTMYRTSRCGDYLLQLCTTVSCMLRGCDSVLDHIKNKLQIEVGETTADGKFTLVTVECLGSCGTAPVLQVNDDYYEDMDIERTDKLLDALGRGQRPEFGPGPGPRRVVVE
ncbi:MAG: NAD(P)H-dependent oxidoreductase subunit E [Acidobacteriota bacterium]|nr:MAG: NAD(P)H-dependent oxidoreductase subunit E [Acidobacteriota bacterium]